MFMMATQIKISPGVSVSCDIFLPKNLFPLLCLSSHDPNSFPTLSPSFGWANTSYNLHFRIYIISMH